MRRIRPVYSVIVNYAAAVSRVASGLVLFIVLGRGLSLYEFAAFGVVQAFAELAAMIARVWGTWSQRALAGIPGTPERAARAAAGTDLAVTATYALAVAPVYAVFAWVESRLLGVGPGQLALGYAYVFARLVEDVGLRLAGVVRPYLQGYARLLGDAVRLPSAVILVYWAGAGLPGAFAAVALGSMASSIFLLASLWIAGVGLRALDWSLARLWLSSWRASLAMLSPGLARTALRPYLSALPNGGEAVSGLNAVLAGENAILRGAHAVYPVVYAHAASRPGPCELRRGVVVYAAAAGLPVSAYLAAPKALTSLVAPEYAFAAPAAVLHAVASLFFGLALLYRGILFAFDPPDPPVRDVLSYRGVRAAVYQAAGVASAYAAAGLAAAIGEGADGVLVALSAAFAVSTVLIALMLHGTVRGVIGGSPLPAREAGAVAASVAVGAAAGRGIVGDFTVYSIVESVPRLALLASVVLVSYVATLLAASAEVRRLLLRGAARLGVLGPGNQGGGREAGRVED